MSDGGLKGAGIKRKDSKRTVRAGEPMPKSAGMTFEFDADTALEFREAIFNAMDAVIETFKTTGVRSGDLHFEYKDTNVKMTLKKKSNA